MTIIIFIIVLAVLVFVHELGHFLAAKAVGARVDEFGLGFPPRLLAVRRGETEYSLNMIPFGGFVKIFGENPDDGELSPDVAGRTLGSKPKLLQAVVLLAGITFNWIFAWLLISIGLASGLPMSTQGVGASFEGIEDTKTVVVQVLEGGPAETAGLLAGDTITSIKAGDKEILEPAISEFQSIVKNSAGPVTVAYSRGGKEDEALISALSEGSDGPRMIGVSLDEIGIAKLPLIKAFGAGFKLTVHLTFQLITGLKNIITGLFAGDSVADAVVGPVGLAGLVGNARALGFIYLLAFMAFISIDLAIINLIPFPALDGGRLLFLLIEAVKGSPIKPKVSNFLNVAGFLVLIGLMLLVTVADIWRLF